MPTPVANQNTKRRRIGSDSELMFNLILLGGLVGLSVFNYFYLREDNRKRVMRKMFLEIQKELEGFFPPSTEFVQLNKKQDLAKLEDFSLQILVIPPSQVSKDSLGARLITLDKFPGNVLLGTRSYACEIGYYGVNYNIPAGQIDLMQFTKAYPKFDVHADLIQKGYTTNLIKLGRHQIEDLGTYAKLVRGREDYDERSGVSNEKTAIENIALETKNLIKKAENILIYSNGGSNQTQAQKALPNPKAKRSSYKTSKASKKASAKRKQIASAAQNKRRTALKKKMARGYRPL